MCEGSLVEINTSVCNKFKLNLTREQSLKTEATLTFLIFYGDMMEIDSSPHADEFEKTTVLPLSQNSSPMHSLPSKVHHDSKKLQAPAYLNMIKNDRVRLVNHDLMQKAIEGIGDKTVSNLVKEHNICIDKEKCNTNVKIKLLLEHITSDDEEISYTLISAICRKLDKEAIASHIQCFGLRQEHRVTDNRATLVKYLTFTEEASDYTATSVRTIKKRKLDNANSSPIEEEEISITDTPARKKATKLVPEAILKTPKIKKKKKALRAHSAKKKRVELNSKIVGAGVDKSTNTFDRDPDLVEISNATKLMEENTKQIKTNLASRDIPSTCIECLSKTDKDSVVSQY